MNAICLIVDRLHAGCVGAYGNAWLETPAMDRLASQSMVFDRMLIDSPQLERLYRSYWQGWHAMCPDAPGSRRSLPGMIRDAGVRTILATDEPIVAKHPLAADFDEIIEIDPAWEPTTAAEIEQTHFARCFVRIIERLESAEEPFLLWCHLAGLGSTWDAPLEFRQAYCDESDPRPPTSADVPDRLLPTDYDPDELLGVSQSYAGQVTLFDTCFGAFAEFLDERFGAEDQKPLLAFASARGFPLGEHRRVGACDAALFGELVNAPLIVRMPDGSGCAMRNQSLVEPSDVWATFLEYFGVAPAPHSPTALSLLPILREEQKSLSARDRLCVFGSPSERAIRTPAWYLRAVSTDESSPQLFAKPDDRWEANDVASRCSEVVECLQDAMLQYDLSLPAGRIDDLPPLADVLITGLD